jgi:pSer/pThr/pTyr-binding forkhead associated (FHA) protein
VGRGEKVDAQTDDVNMSRQHFVISPKENGYVLQDQNSRNGTLVNGKRVTEMTTLKPNDTIRAGQTLFVFVEGMATVIGKLQDEPKSYGTHLREISKEAKP